MFLERLMTDAFGDCKLGMSVGVNIINNLRYAYDIVILATSVADHKSLKQRLVEVCDRKMLTINATKTKIMKIRRRPEEVVILLLGEHG